MVNWMYNTLNQEHYAQLDYPFDWLYIKGIQRYFITGSYIICWCKQQTLNMNRDNTKGFQNIVWNHFRKNDRWCNCIYDMWV